MRCPNLIKVGPSLFTTHFRKNDLKMSMRSDATQKNFSTKKDTNSKRLGSYKPPKRCGRENLIDKEMEGKASLLPDFFEFRSKFSRCSKVSSFTVPSNTLAERETREKAETAQRQSVKTCDMKIVIQTQQKKKKKLEQHAC